MQTTRLGTSSTGCRGPRATAPDQGDSDKKVLNNCIKVRISEIGASTMCVCCAAALPARSHLSWGLSAAYRPSVPTSAYVPSITTWAPAHPPASPPSLPFLSFSVLILRAVPARDHSGGCRGLFQHHTFLACSSCCLSGPGAQLNMQHWRDTVACWRQAGIDGAKLQCYPRKHQKPRYMCISQTSVGQPGGVVKPSQASNMSGKRSLGHGPAPGARRGSCITTRLLQHEHISCL